MIVQTPADKPRTLEDLIPPGLAGTLDRLDLVSRKIFAGKLPGERRSKRRGRSVEFDDFRNYTAGDDLRHIDWNVYARLDRLFIKLFREEEDLALHVVVDASPSMQAGAGPGAGGGPRVPSKLVFAHQVAMALSYIGLINQNRVTASVFGRASGAVASLAPVRGRGGVVRVANFLLASLDDAWQTPGASPEGASSSPIDRFSAEIKSIASRRSGRGVMVVLSDFLVPGGPGALTPAFGALAAAGSAAFDTSLLQVLSPGELDPSVEGAGGEDGGRLLGDLRLTDAETGRGREVTISPALVAAYRKRVQAYTEGIKSLAASRGLAAYLVPTTTAVETLVLDSLRRGGMLR
ncbi:MAG: DUF58 domain-containing protein [Tepidisphaera sp.]